MLYRWLAIVLFGAAVALAVCVWGVTNLVSQPIGKSSMHIQVSMTLGRPDLIAGEQTPVTIKVVNISKNTISLPDITTSGTWPKLQVRNIQTGTDVVYGPAERPDPHADNFVPPLPATTIQLAPGQELQRTEDLYSWVGPLRPGRYELSAMLTFAESSGKSANVRLTIAPAQLQSSFTVGPDSGNGNFRNTFWVSKSEGSSVALLTVYSFDGYGHANVSVSKRFAEVHKPLRLIPSITQNGLPYPSQWIVALDEQNLYTLFLKQTKVTSPLRSNHLDLTGPAAIVGPIWLDLEGNDGSRPGLGLVPIWQNGKIGVWTIQPDGSVQAGPHFFVEQGELRWGSNVWLSKGERRIIVATAGGGYTVVEMLRWSGGSSAVRVTIGKFPGDTVGGGVTLSNDDHLQGGIVLRAGSDYSVQTWAVDPGGAVNIRPAHKLRFALPVKFENAKVAMSAAGASLVLLENNDHHWFWTFGKEIAQEVTRSGVLADGFWLYETSPMLVLGSDMGITYESLQ